MARYRFTPQAEQDLLEIAEFIAKDRPDEANRLIDKTEQKCRALAAMPEMGRQREELASGLRSAVVGRYLLFYRSDIAHAGIEIIRVIHGSRDIQSCLTDPAARKIPGDTSARRRPRRLSWPNRPLSPSGESG
jgi:toxin ParE1/3/4